MLLSLVLDYIVLLFSIVSIDLSLLLRKCKAIVEINKNVNILKAVPAFVKSKEYGSNPIIKEKNNLYNLFLK